MARPISLELPPRDPREELRKRLEEAPVKHAEALLDSYELLQQLHEHGVFELLRGALSASDKLIETAVDAAKSDESIRAMRNAMILGKMLGVHQSGRAAGRCRRRSGKHWDVTRSQLLSRRAFSRFLASSAIRNCGGAWRSLNKFLEILGNQIKLRGGCK